MFEAAWELRSDAVCETCLGVAVSYGLGIEENVKVCIVSLFVLLFLVVFGCFSDFYCRLLFICCFKWPKLGIRSVVTMP
jgi:hypothetical protein